MTRQRTFKRIVRARMTKTGESYVAARAALLSAESSPLGGRQALATSDEAIRHRTGAGWEEWFDLLDEWGAATRSHREIARWVAARLGIEPLVWEAQAITVSFERSRGLRVVGERADGFAVTAQKTFAVPAERLFDAFVVASFRERWLPDAGLPDAGLRERTSTRPKVAHFDWPEGQSRVHVTFVAKGEGRCTAALEHARLADSDEAGRMRSYWRLALAALRVQLEGEEATRA